MYGFRKQNYIACNNIVYMVEEIRAYITIKRYYLILVPVMKARLVEALYYKHIEISCSIICLWPEGKNFPYDG